MADKPNMITVKGAGDNRKVVLWERDANHPNGEVVIANTGEEHRVAETATVKRMLADGLLVKASEAKSAPKPDSKPN